MRTKATPAPTAPPYERYGAAAAMLAAGIGCAAFGACVVGAAASEELARLLTVSEAVGPLSGKALAAVAVWLPSWVVLHVALRDRHVSFPLAFRVTLALIGIALMRFPLVYERLSH